MLQCQSGTAVIGNAIHDREIYIFDIHTAPENLGAVTWAAAAPNCIRVPISSLVESGIGQSNADAGETVLLRVDPGQSLAPALGRPVNRARPSGGNN